MPPRQKSLTRGRWSSLALSLLLHSAIVATAVLAWKFWKSPPPPIETAAIEGTLVDESALKGIKPIPNPEPTPPPPDPEPLPPPEPEPQPEPEEIGPPKPDPAELERLNAEKEKDRKAQEQIEQEKLEQQKRDQEQKAEQERIENEKQAAVKAAAEKAAADKKKADEAAAKKRAADEAAARKRAADEAAAKKAADDLRRSMEAEERGRALQNSDEAARWHAQIVAKIQRAWIKPPSAQPGISCTVSVTQVPGGEVTSVRVDSCNGGDAALRESVERAVYNASPLPSPPDPALFERNLELTFAPTS